MIEETEVAQADRELAADIWRDYVAKIGEVMVEKAIRKGTMDSSLPTLLARHRLASSPPADVKLREAIMRLRNGYADAVAGLAYIRQNYGSLAGVGWQRVEDHFERWVTIPEREGLCAGSHNLAALTEQQPTTSTLLAASQPASMPEGEQALAWLAEHQNLELHHYMPVYGDDDDDAFEWRVTKVSGPINDREWDTIGKGETPLAALQAAMIQASPQYDGGEK